MNMLSNLDRYNRTQMRGTSGDTYMGTTEFINMKLAEETPMFSKQKVNFSPPHPITDLVVNNNNLILAMANRTLLRIDLRQPDNHEEIDASRFAPQARIYKLFLDPSGNHCIISISGRDKETAVDALYLHKHTIKLKQITKLPKGQLVSAVGWGQQQSPKTVTGPILIGTTKGLIFESEFTLVEDRLFTSNLEQYWKQVHDISSHMTDMDCPHITDMNYFVMNEGTHYCILAVTSTRLYQFLRPVSHPEERPLLMQVFQSYVDLPDRFLELPGSWKTSQLRFFTPKEKFVPSVFAFFVSQGVLYGDIEQPESESEDSVTRNTKLIQFPNHPQDPIAIVLTEFHVLLAYTDRIKGLCVLNEQLVFEDVYNEVHGKLMGVTVDPVTSTIWAYCERAVFRYRVTRESRNMWKVYMEQGNFELAKQYCNENPVSLNEVLCRQAEHFFNQQEYEQSAMCYAQTHSSFEDITLKFVEVDQKPALRVFLRKKMDGVKSSDKTQLTMLIMWILELYLHEIGLVKEQKKLSPSSPHFHYDTLHRQLFEFLSEQKVKDCLSENKNTVYDVLGKHGDTEYLMHFMMLMKDYARVIHEHIQLEKYHQALDVLRRHSSEEHFYMFAADLMSAAPQQTVDVLIAQGRRLRPLRILPAIIHSDSLAISEEHGKEAIRYLEFCINHLKSPEEALHNNLINLYCRLQPEKLMQYLQLHGNDVDTCKFDVQYALRTCLEHNHLHACVHLHSIMGHYDSAVDLALNLSPELAKTVANSPEENLELKKKLWLKIAKYVVKEESDIKKAMEFVQESQLIKIEDILPFFPDFVTIDHFKDAICSSLQEYSEHIGTLQTEMEDASKSAEQIRSEIQTFRNRSIYVSGSDICKSCGASLFTGGFYVFPCGHKFHRDCLMEQVLPHLTTSVRTKLEDLMRQLAGLSLKEDTISTASNSSSMNMRDQLKKDINETMAAQCIYCGDMVVSSIDKPFIEDEEYLEVMRDWE